MIVRLPERLDAMPIVELTDPPWREFVTRQLLAPVIRHTPPVLRRVVGQALYRFAA